MMHALIKLQMVVVLKFVGNAEIGGEKKKFGEEKVMRESNKQPLLFNQKLNPRTVSYTNSTTVTF